MAESRGSLLAKSVQKHAGRAKEKLLQNLGKVDRTADEIFDEHLQNFTRQQNAANRLQKEFSNYIRCVRACQAASKTLLEAIGDIYESQWTGHDLMYVQTQSVDMLWQDFSHKLADQVLLPLNTYQGQFPEMRKKIDKRGRKLVDYDSQRHSFQALQTNMKKRDEAKIAKGREQLDEAKRTYEMLNSELHDELPALYDSRILFLVTNLQSLFNAENTFHIESAKVFGELEAIVDKLATDSQRGSYSVKKTNGASLPHSTTITKPKELIINNTSTLNSDRGASTENLPPGVLYRVKATYKYNREDVDELSFEVGEIISVVEYDDPEEQEEGWLMGIKDNGDKGMFPANFTRPL
ncbi:myc box-dependent-interacting protein 1 isoform X2 [Diorhabda carinulata]|uniref:myc box-dependent-interacting protein 1 isoform X2 n=1 Tax=Diorhabda sublineata TaxID=1163346 RepID=UPI0024E12A6F|nr:myc box-dependent-interacting protein 1 isoform X2 [Diorhabda sublineata]XP_057659836.1 myc box-dependent-interacting protein 1 isoform X2 [Diorhabda carinulata]